MKRAIISVSDKTGIVEFAKELQSLGIEIISTGGTYKTLKENGINVIGVSDVTGFSECLDGRVKTLHPSIHGGILAIRDNLYHMQQIASLDIHPIDFVVVNLYPFKETILKEDVTLSEAIENIDIGGPTMIRAGAKNYRFVTVITDPSDYTSVIDELKESGLVSEHTNFQLATKVFMHTAHYDTLIAQYLKPKTDIEQFPNTLTISYEKVQDMRYGENPHQTAAFYKDVKVSSGMLTDVVQIHGKSLSFNNINDTNGALELLKEYAEPTVVACKHGNPCGVGSGKIIYDAYMKAFTCDPVSIFGGIVVANRTIDEKTAFEISKIFIEIILAPSFTPEAIEILSVKKSIRLLTLSDIANKQNQNELDYKKVSGGLLVQNVNNVILPETKIRVVTTRKPTEKEKEDLLFTWKVVKYVKSNAIAIGRDQQTIGIGAGQVNRIWACKQAIEHGIEYLGANVVEGSVMASDAFFPFADCVEEAQKAGITAIIQPGGSINDEQSISLCNKHGIAMVFTDMRHFKH